MKRIAIPPRKGWQSIVEKQGLGWHSERGVETWNESAVYILTQAEVESLVLSARELAGLFQTACGNVVKHNLWPSIGLKSDGAKIVGSSWNKQEFSLCGRFDFLFDENGTPKLLEYNAETALSLVETAVIQKAWLADIMPDRDQFNVLESHLIRAWRSSGFEQIHCAWRPRHAEVEGTVRYMTNILKAAGIPNSMIALHRIGWHPAERRFVDEDGLPIRCCYKLYPWHWMLDEPFARRVNEAGCNFVEPPWRLVAGGKGILCVLSELFPDHPSVLACLRSPERLGDTYVSKPLFGHEGRNVTVHKNGAIHDSLGGEYVDQEKVFQAFVNSPRYDGFLPQFGVWMVGHQPAAIGIRETRKSIISADSAFVPHAIDRADVVPQHL